MKEWSMIVVLSISVLLSSAACADEYPYIYKGFRPMGMGGAFIAVSDDGNALFYNPAGLADVQEEKRTLLSIEVEQSKDGIKGYKDFKDLDTADPVGTANFLRDYIGKYNHAAVSVFPNLVKPNLAFGIYGRAQENFTAHNSQYPELDVYNVTDAGIAVGFSRSFLEDKLSLGTNIKFNMRRSLDKDYTLPEITTGGFDDRMDDDTQDGAGALLDVGALYRIGEITSSSGRKINVQTGLSLSNLIGSRMGDAEDLPVHMDAGIALKSEPIIIALDYIDILDNFDQDSDIPKRLRIGVEYIYDNIYAVRGGFYQGYPSFGVSLNKKKVEVDLLTYAEEVGSYSGQLKNRRYAFRFAFGF